MRDVVGSGIKLKRHWRQIGQTISLSILMRLTRAAYRIKTD
jgi:hypothetical protein